MYFPGLLPYNPLLISATCQVVPLPYVVVPEPEPLPEPLLAPVEESQVLLPETKTGEA
jgi:hypothetical protein